MTRQPTPAFSVARFGRAETTFALACQRQIGRALRRGGGAVGAVASGSGSSTTRQSPGGGVPCSRGTVQRYRCDAAMLRISEITSNSQTGGPSGMQTTLSPNALT